MLGMRRPAPAASLDGLELERSVAASKVRKDDALSIYEATLEKLRRGSRRAFCVAESNNVEPSASEAAASPSRAPPEPDGSIKPMETL